MCGVGECSARLEFQSVRITLLLTAVRHFDGIINAVLRSAALLITAVCISSNLTRRAFNAECLCQGRRAGSIGSSTCSWSCLDVRVVGPEDIEVCSHVAVSAHPSTRCRCKLPLGMPELIVAQLLFSAGNFCRSAQRNLLQSLCPMHGRCIALLCNWRASTAGSLPLSQPCQRHAQRAPASRTVRSLTFRHMLI